MYDRARNVVAAYHASKNPLRMLLESLLTMLRGPGWSLQHVRVAKRVRSGRPLPQISTSLRNP